MSRGSFIAIIVVLAAWVAVIHNQIQRNENQLRGIAAKQEMLQRQIDSIPRQPIQITPKPNSIKLLEVSCYTPVESHGAVGRTEGVSAATFQYPIGTRIYIEGIGERVVETHTAARFANRVDVWMVDYDACIQFGVQTRKVWAI